MTWNRQNYGLIVAVTTLCLSAAFATAAATPGALVNFEIEGSTDNGNTYSSTVHVVAGQTVSFEVLGYLSQVGTANTSSNKSITSLVNGQDDITQDNFNLNEASSTQIPIAFVQSSLALSSKYNAGSGGPSAGVASGSTITNIFAAAGGSGSTVPLAANPTLILTGQFVVGGVITSNATTTIGGAYDFTDDGGGSFKINGGASVILYSGTENQSQPLTDYLGLTVTDIPAPEPSSISLLGISGLGLLSRQRRLKRNS